MTNLYKVGDFLEHPVLAGKYYEILDVPDQDHNYYITRTYVYNRNVKRYVTSKVSIYPAHFEADFVPVDPADVALKLLAENWDD